MNRKAFGHFEPLPSRAVSISRKVSERMVEPVGKMSSANSASSIPNPHLRVWSIHGEFVTGVQTALVAGFSLGVRTMASNAAAEDALNWVESRVQIVLMDFAVADRSTQNRPFLCTQSRSFDTSPQGMSPMLHAN